MNGVSVENVNELGYAKQQPYFYTDKNQEIIEGGGLIEVEGIGKVITYQDVYIGAIVISFISLIFGAIIFYRDRSDMTNLEGLGYWMFGNCIVGAFLIALTTKANIPSTILFSLGLLVTACGKHQQDRYKRNNLFHNGYGFFFGYKWDF